VKKISFELAQREGYPDQFESAEAAQILLGSSPPVSRALEKSWETG
jgi:hypothetical protein